jgi:hypothetical protein
VRLPLWRDLRGSFSASQRLRVQPMTTCAQCLKDYEADDILWATPTGDLEGDTRPYCVACAPNQPNYEREI